MKKIIFGVVMLSSALAFADGVDISVNARLNAQYCVEFSTPERLADSCAAAHMTASDVALIKAQRASKNAAVSSQANVDPNSLGAIRDNLQFAYQDSCHFLAERQPWECDQSIQDKLDVLNKEIASKIDVDPMLLQMKKQRDEVYVQYEKSCYFLSERRPLVCSSDLSKQLYDLDSAIKSRTKQLPYEIHGI